MVSRTGLGLETDQDRVSKVLILVFEHLVLVLVFACNGLGLMVAGLGLVLKAGPLKYMI